MQNRFEFPANNLVITSTDIQSVEPVDQRTRDALQKICPVSHRDHYTQVIESVLPQCTISDSEDEMDKGCYYSINPDRKSEYSVKKWHTRIVFKTVSHLSMKLKEKCVKLVATL